MSPAKKFKPKPRPPVRGSCSHAGHMSWPDGVSLPGDECYCKACGRRWVLTEYGWKVVSIR